MATHKLSFEESFKIRASEIDADQKATLPAICNLLQEIAGNHARQLEFDITDLQQNKLTWVLRRLRVEINRFPDWRETITIRTWPSGGDGLRAYRDFLILDGDENIIGRSLSYWLILDMEKHRPTRIPGKILQMVPNDTKHVLPVEDRHFSELDEADTSRTFKVRKTDLDLNQHVNNVKYIEWALSCLPDGAGINKVDIKFVAESVLDDTVVASCKSVAKKSPQQAFFHQIKRSRDQKILALAQTM